MIPLDNSIQNISICTCLELINEFWRLEGDAGLQRKLFADFAENNPDAFSSFAEILAQSTSKVLRALAMQGLGQIPLQNCPNYQGEDLKGFFKTLFAELRSSSDLLKWSACKVVSEIVPPIILESRQLWEQGEPLDRTELSRSVRQMQSTYTNKINYFDIHKRGKHGNEPEYERYLEYWVYCDTSALFTEDSNSDNYRSIVEHALAKLQGYGIILALGYQGLYTTNKIVQDATLRQARLTYTTDDNQKLLYDHLAWYIENSTHADNLRVHAAETFNLTGNWKPVIDKFKILSNFLLGSQVLRDGAIKILLPQKSALQQNISDAAILLTAFIHLRDYKLNNTANLEKLSLTKIERFFKTANGDLSLINKIADLGKQSATDLSKKLNSDANYAKQHIQDLQNQHIDQIQNWLKRLDQAYQDFQKPKKNQAALDKVYNDVSKLDTSIYNDITSISDQDARHSKDYETLEESKLLLARLESLRKSVEIKLSPPSSLTTSGESTNLRERTPVTVIWAVSIIVLTAISHPAKTWLLYNPVAPPGSSSGNVSSNSSSSTQSISSSWYNTGFPKPNGCGGGTSSNGQWHPVFVKYNVSNWQGIIENHCGDIGTAQSKEIANEKGQIQVASFGNRQDAEGFAAYMKSQYGSGWVGKN